MVASATVVSVAMPAELAAAWHFCCCLPTRLGRHETLLLIGDSLVGGLYSELVRDTSDTSSHTNCLDARLVSMSGADPTGESAGNTSSASLMSVGGGGGSASCGVARCAKLGRSMLLYIRAGGGPPGAVLIDGSRHRSGPTPNAFGASCRGARSSRS